MANALPILLIGGAALLMMGGKKKGDTRTALPKPGELVLPPTTPPPLTKTVKKSGSGYPGVTRARMQEIQTMLLANGYDLGKWRADGKYGPATKAAVLAFQKDHMPKSDGWDGKPGPKTQATLQRVEAERVSGQQQEAQKFPEEAEQIVDECNPLDAGTWGSGNVCVLVDNRWVRQRAQVKKSVSSGNAPGTPAGKKCSVEAVADAIAGGSGDLEKMQRLLNYDARCQGLFSAERRSVIQIALGQKPAPTTKTSGPPASDLVSANPGLEEILEQGIAKRKDGLDIHWQMRQLHLPLTAQFKDWKTFKELYNRDDAISAFWYDRNRRKWRYFTMIVYYRDIDEYQVLRKNLLEMLYNEKPDMLSGVDSWPAGKMPSDGLEWDASPEWEQFLRQAWDNL